MQEISAVSPKTSGDIVRLAEEVQWLEERLQEPLVSRQDEQKMKGQQEQKVAARRDSPAVDCRLQWP